MLHTDQKGTDMKNADRPAYPIVISEEEAITGLTKIGKYDGLTKREYFSAVALQGILMKYGENNFSRRDSMAEIAVGYADALLKELGK